MLLEKVSFLACSGHADPHHARVRPSQPGGIPNQPPGGGWHCARGGVVLVQVGLSIPLTSPLYLSASRDFVFLTLLAPQPLPLFHRCNGVRRTALCAFTPASRSSNSRAISACPLFDARCNRVQPSVPYSLAFMSWSSNNQAMS